MRLPFKRKDAPESNVRRRQTHGGSKSPVFSYYQNREGLDEREPVERTRSSAVSFLQRIPSYIAGVIIAGSLLYSMTLTTTPKVIVVNDQEKAVQGFLRKPETYQNIMQSGLRGSIFNRTKLTINTDGVAQHFKEALPEATDVSITLPLLGRNPVVYVRIAEPSLLMTTNDRQLFVVDEQGRAVIEAAQLPNLHDLDLALVTDKSGIEVSAGKAVLPQDQVIFMRGVQTQLAAARLKVGRFVLPARANELHFTPKGKPYYVKMNFLHDYREQVGRYLALKTYLDKKKAEPNQYVDVRVPDRAYVK